MAIASPYTASFCCTARSAAAATASQRSLLQPVSWRARTRFQSTRVVAQPAIVSQLNPPHDDEVPHELNAKRPRHRSRGSFPVYVTLPVDTVDLTTCAMQRKRTMAHSFRALALAGVEGVVMEVWWGVVERQWPCNYNWAGYLDVVEMAVTVGLKVRAVMAFHQRGSGPNDPLWIPLPLWLRTEMDKQPNLAFADKHGRRSSEYISLGCDDLPLLIGRTPLQAYADLMRDFKETFRSFLGGVITGVQVGLGPNGELRYPSCPSEMLSCSWTMPREIGEFQCYDKYMIASLNAWMGGYTGPDGTSYLMRDTEFLRSDGDWGSPYGSFFLKWYSGMLLLHGERICTEAEKIFQDSQIEMLGKVASVHWHYHTLSRPSQLTCGYNNTIFRDGFRPFLRMFARHDFTVCCPCFEMEDAKEKRANPTSSPEGFVKDVVEAAGVCDVPVAGENFSNKMDDDSYKQVIKMVKRYCDGVKAPSFSFNLVRMDKNLFKPQNWASFTRFVKLMSMESNLDLGGGWGGGGGGGWGGGGGVGGSGANNVSPLAFNGDAALHIG